MGQDKKVGICTLFTGYNFGSALQAYATKTVLEEMNFHPYVIKLSGSVVGGRDIRIKKAMCTFVRMLFHSKNKKKVFNSFTENGKNNINSKVVHEFDAFYKKSLNPLYVSYNELKKMASEKEWCAYICGSDQVWNSASFYVDPFYYLNFAPTAKRIAYAPSFGRDFIPKYNKRIIAKYLNKIRFLSVRETTGKALVKELVGRDASVCLDPTLLLDKDAWCKNMELSNIVEKDYILCYFLNEPNKKAKKFLKSVSDKTGAKIIFVNKAFGDNVVYCGPEGFLNYIKNAKMVVTDSFHGVAFSLNFNKKFFVFDRQYTTDDQSTRIKSLLGMVGLSRLFEYNGNPDDITFDYAEINKLISCERIKSLDYLVKSLEEVCHE